LLSIWQLIFYPLFQRQLWRWWQPASSALLLLLLTLLRLLALLLSIVMELIFGGCLFTSRSIALLTKNALRLRPAFPL
jgi:hypothetical protein